MPLVHPDLTFDRSAIMQTEIATASRKRRSKVPARKPDDYDCGRYAYVSPMQNADGFWQTEYRDDNTNETFAGEIRLARAEAIKLARADADELWGEGNYCLSIEP